MWIRYTLLILSLLKVLASAEVASTAVQSSVLLVKGDNGVGSAFVVEQDGKQYIYTNAHVLAFQNKISFQTINGKSIKHGPQVQVAKSKDIARIPLVGKPFKTPLELVTNSEIKLGETVIAYGNSGGEGVITSLEGEVLGVGPDEIEVDSEIIPGNSGGPILRQGTGEVVAIATRGQASTSPWAAETRFENIRRFGLRAEKSVQWETTSFNTLIAEAKKIRSINIDSVSLMALSILTATQRGLYIPESLEVGPGGVAHQRQADNATPNSRNSSSPRKSSPSKEEAKGKTFVVKEWLGANRRNRLTKTIWLNIVKLNRALGYGTNKPPRAMVEVKRHYAAFFKPIFSEQKSEIRDKPSKISNVHRAAYEEALALRKEASGYMMTFAQRISKGILDTGLSGGN